MEREILALDSFCEAHGIDYVITGTYALKLHGLLPKFYEVGDIDIRICNISPQSRDTPMDLQQLSVPEVCGYADSKCMQFKVASTPVSAILVDEEDPSECVRMRIEYSGKAADLRVHSVSTALREKMKLQRPKDIRFMNDLVRTILSY